MKEKRKTIATIVTTLVASHYFLDKGNGARVNQISTGGGAGFGYYLTSIFCNRAKMSKKGWKRNSLEAIGSTVGAFFGYNVGEFINKNYIEQDENGSKKAS